jgi:hypothetical protein
MIRPLALSLAAGIALLTASECGAVESFPVVHNEPITVRILGGKDGQPLAHLHLVLLAGYDQSDLHDQLYRAELLTDAHGQAHLPKQLANLPWLQVWVNKMPLCQAKPRGNSFSVELIRRDGVSAPNLCGTATVEDAPGVFTVFVKSKEKKAPSVTLVTRAEVPAPVTVATAQPAALAPARKPAEAETRPPTAQIPAVPVAAALPVAPTAAEKAVMSAEPARPVVAASASVPARAPSAVQTPAMAVVTAPAPAVDAAKDSHSVKARVAEYRPVRGVAGRPVLHRATPVSHSARQVTHRARPVLASCVVRKTRAKAEPPAASSASSEDKPATAIDATHKSKPAAGVKLEAVTPDKPKTPHKQE